jgi:hypothetical protein
MMESRRSRIVVLVGGLVALVFGLIDRAPSGGSQPRLHAIASSQTDGSATGTAFPNETWKSVPRSSRVVDPGVQQPPPVPFSYLGRITEGGETSILLYAGGRTLKVRGVGRLDEQYEVEAIHDDHLVLRYIRLGTQQVLALASRQYVVTGGSAADTQQD